ncbi:MAG: DUF1641 domain-containing protein [Gemmatimonadota bacterium]
MSNELTAPGGNGSGMAEPSGPQMDKLFEACQKLDRATEILLELKRDKEMIMELGQDLMPMANGIIHLTSDRLQEFEQDGTLDFIREGVGVLQRVSTAFTPEDVRLLGDNIVHILMTVRNLTQPEVLGLADRATSALKGKTTPTPVGTLGLLRAIRDPEVRKGTGVLLELLRSLGRDAGSAETTSS